MSTAVPDNGGYGENGLTRSNGETENLRSQNGHGLLSDVTLQGLAKRLLSDSFTTTSRFPGEQPSDNVDATRQENKTVFFFIACFDPA